ncbi:uncharacterized protein METZ01_LOCUS298568, partial [marine metagenome]
MLVPPQAQSFESNLEHNLHPSPN